MVAALLAAGAAVGLARDWFPPWGRSEATPSAAPPSPSATSPISRRTTSQNASAPPTSFASIAEEANPAVVNIATTQTVKGGETPGVGPFGPFGGENDPFEEFFRRFAPQMPKSFKRRSLGSGFLITSDGYIVTNHHVVDKADEIVVRLTSNQHEYKAKVIGSDAKTDLAVVKIDTGGKSMPTLRFGDSDKMRVGDWVLAIGDPFGLEHTVTAGIVSAKGRVIGQGPYDDFIQTDASINPGNSGGPLLNLSGEVVGIDSAIFSETGGNVGIGFAIPSNLARSVIEQLRTHGKVIRGWLGVAIQDVTEDLAKSFNLSEGRGALVSDVKPGGPADKAGVERGDVVLSYDGKKISSSHDLPAMVAATPIGKDVVVEVLRNGGEKTLHVKVGEMPKDAGQESAAGPPASGDELGLRIAPVTPDLARTLGIEPGAGVVVEAVKSGSAADEAGLRPGDVVQEVNRRPVKSVDDFKRAVRDAKGKDTILFLVRRGDSTVFLALRRGK